MFLELNLEILSDIVFVDDSDDFVLYDVCGFGKFIDVKSEKVDLKSTNFSFKDWLVYFGNVGKLVLIKKG